MLETLDVVKLDGIKEGEGGEGKSAVVVVKGWVAQHCIPNLRLRVA